MIPKSARGESTPMSKTFSVTGCLLSLIKEKSDENTNHHDAYNDLVNKIPHVCADRKFII